MNGAEWIRGLADDGEPDDEREISWADMREWAAEHHGGPRKANRYLADRLGVGIRNVQRWVKGQHPARSAPADIVAAIRGEVERSGASDVLRRIKAVSPGRVQVMSTSPRKGGSTEYRSVNQWLDVDFSAAADAWDAGDEDQAERELGVAIMNAYGDTSGVDELGAKLEVEDYVEGIDFTTDDE